MHSSCTEEESELGAHSTSEHLRCDAVIAIGRDDGSPLLDLRHPLLTFRFLHRFPFVLFEEGSALRDKAL